MKVEFKTRDDANTFVANYGITDWTWSGSANAEGFANYLWERYSGVNDPEYPHERRDDYAAADEALRAYLSSEGENPADYGL